MTRYRLLAIGAAALGLAALVSPQVAGRADALSADVVSCPHLHLTYSFAAPGTTDASYAVNVSASQCADGASTSTSASGSGSVTFLGTADNPACAGGLFVECDRFELNIAIGSAVVSPGFTTLGPVYFQAAGPQAAPNSLFDFGTAGAITGFDSGHGAGALNSVCTFAGGVITCTADGSFTWAAGV